MLSYLYTLEYDDSRGGPVLSCSRILTTATTVDSENTEPTPKYPDTSITHTVMSFQETDHEIIYADLYKHHKHMLMSNVQVYALAEKYDIQALKELAMTKFEALFNPNDFSPHIKLADYMRDYRGRFHQHSRDRFGAS